MDDMEFIEIGPHVSALVRSRERYLRESGNAQGVQLLDLARGVAETQVDLEGTRADVRRDLHLPLEEIDRLITVARRVGEESFVEQHAMMELIQAASVTSCDLVKRSMVSGMLAAAARLAERYERARLAYADALEGIRILSRYFPPQESDLTMVELATWTGWDEVKHLSEPVLEVFDPACHEPDSELVELIAWNSDQGNGQGFLAGSDATLRLAMRVRDWIDRRDWDPGPLMPKLITGCIAAASGDAFVAARYLVTLGDALAEVERWELAIEALHACRAQMPELHHPLRMHTDIQEARCHLMLGDLDSCRSALEAVDLQTLESLSRLVITVAAELARYHSVEHERRRRAAAHDPADRPALIRDLLRDVSAIFSPSARDRTGYLRNLFFAMLVRDLESLRTASV